MSWQRRHSPCGRLPGKPEDKEIAQKSALMEEAMPIPQQIENLRTKIALKERYNNVLKDEMEESLEGAGNVLKDLYQETVSLRQSLYEAIVKEKLAVQSALRTHRDFQLALRSKTPEFAIGWLDDKLFDNAKWLNVLIDRLIGKRKRMNAAELEVKSIEKWPRPGTLPWETKMFKKFHDTEIAIAAVGVRLETARILYNKYKEIKYKLRDEKERYGPVIINLESQLDHQTQELNTLQQMLEDAKIFLEEAGETLQITEKEASLNRKKRRIQMAKIKKAVQKILEENSLAEKKNTLQKIDTVEPGIKWTAGKSFSAVELNNAHMDKADRLNMKRAEIEKMQGLVSRLVETMRVPDLTFIPDRLGTIIRLGKQLIKERNVREELCKWLIHQRDQLLLILHYLRYTGSESEIEYRMVLEYYENTLEATKAGIEHRREMLRNSGDKITEVEMGITAILVRLDDKNQDPIKIKNSEHLLLLFPTIHKKIKKLISARNNLQSLFRRESSRDYASAVKPTNIPDRLVRVGTPLISDLSEEDEFDDYKVPTMADIKAKSIRIIQQGILRKGFH